MKKEKEVEIYGCLLSGKESKLAKVKLVRKRFLKYKLRKKIELSIGDNPDIFTDCFKLLLIGQALNLGMVDKADEVQTTFAKIVEDLLNVYGGSQGVLENLESKFSTLHKELYGYNMVKSKIGKTKEIEDVVMIDLPEV